MRRARLFGGGVGAAVMLAVVGLLSVPLPGCCLVWGFIPMCGILACGDAVVRMVIR